MNLQSISDSLPNGFHDAHLRSVSIDYLKSEARMLLNIWVGDLESKEFGIREAERLAELTISDLVYWVMEAPGQDAVASPGKELWIDMGQLETMESQPKIALPPTPSDGFAHWIFVNEWNAFIYFCGKKAEIKWQDQKVGFEKI